MVTVKFKKLHPEAVGPVKAHTNDAAFDLYAVSKKSKNGYLEYDTGLSFEFSPEYVALLFPRSSLSKKKLYLSNHVGVLDANFRNSVTFRFKLAPSGNGVYGVGDRIGQILFIKNEKVIFEEVKTLNKSERIGGYGSSGE